jgi:FlaG/FlaF family flagellin (archaellin)
MKMKNKKIEIKKNFEKNKTGISPVITTILLVALVIVIIGVIFLWFSGMVEEGVTKFGKNIQLVCDDVNFDASYSSGTLSIVNNGNVPLYDLNLKISNAGTYTTKSIKDLSAGESWPKNGLNQGGTFSGDIQSDVGSADTITVLPILIGTSSSGKKTYICEGQYGKAISIS